MYLNKFVKFYCKFGFIFDIFIKHYLLEIKFFLTPDTSALSVDSSQSNFSVTDFNSLLRTGLQILSIGSQNSIRIDYENYFDCSLAGWQTRKLEDFKFNNGGSP
jgi:hypothetical protein